MAVRVWNRFALAWIACLLFSALTASAQAEEIWVAPTYQQDLGGLGVASNVVWPTTPIGAARLAWAVPADLQAFQSAKIVLIPGSAGGPVNLTVLVCSAKNANPVAGDCAGPFAQPFSGDANQLVEVDISAVISGHIGTPGATYLSVLAFTTPTTTSDRIVGLKFSYTPPLPADVATLAANTFAGIQTAPAFIGSGAGLTDLPIPAGAATLGANTFTGTQTAPAFVGSGAGLTDLPVPAGAARLTGGNSFFGAQTYTGAITLNATPALTLQRTDANTPQILLQSTVPPFGRAHEAAFSWYQGGATFDGQWDPVLYLGYNNDAAVPTEPRMRWVIEGNYAHPYRDFETYWEYVSSDATVVQRPIFYFRTKDSFRHGLVFTENNIDFNNDVPGDIYMHFASNNGSQGTVFQENGNRGIGAYASGGPGVGAGYRAFASPFANSQYSGALLLEANGTSDASTNTAEFGISLIAGAKYRQIVHPDGKIAFYVNSTDFTNYERLALNLTAGTHTLAAESGGTGRSDIDIALAPKGSGKVTANSLLNTSTGYQLNGALTTSATAPTISAGGCASPAVTWANGTAAFLITIGTSCSGVKSITLSMPAAANLWACRGDNNTSDAAQQLNTLVSRATSGTEVVITNYARTTGVQEDFTDSDTLLVMCAGG